MNCSEFNNKNSKKFKFILLIFVKYNMEKGQNQNGKLLQRYRACMVLAAVGDAMGYKNGDWEFNTSSKIIHQKMNQMTNNKGVLQLKITLAWPYSDDTVMHIATAKGLILSNKSNKIQQICQNIAIQYKICGKKMSGRAPGKTCMKSIQILNQNGDNWNKIPFNDRSCGCGASMRSACIGLKYFSEEAVEKCVATSIQAGRMTHHNPGGYLGSLVSSYFTSLAVRNIQPAKWLSYLIQIAFPIAEKYIKEAKRQVDFNLKSQNWKRFIDSFKSYAKRRKLSINIKQESKCQFPQNYGIIQRQHFYKQISWGNWPGALGLDSVLIAYDALLGCNQNWEQFCLRGVLHGGDNDSTGTIGAAWFGALYGFKGVPQKHWKQVQDRKKLEILGQQIYKLRQ